MRRFGITALLALNMALIAQQSFADCAAKAQRMVAPVAAEAPVYRVMTAQDIYLADMLKEIFPILADWNLAMKNAEEVRSRANFHDFVLRILLTPSKGLAAQSSPQARSVLDNIRLLKTAFGDEALSRRLVKFLLVEGDELVKSHGEEIDTAFVRLRSNLIRDDANDRAYIF
jgi:hypothetical protein